MLERRLCCVELNARVADIAPKLAVLTDRSRELGTDRRVELVRAVEKLQDFARQRLCTACGGTAAAAARDAWLSPDGFEARIGAGLLEPRRERIHFGGELGFV